MCFWRRGDNFVLLISALKWLFWLIFGLLAVGTLLYLTLVSLRGPQAFAAVVLRLALVVLALVALLVLLNVAQRIIYDRRRRRLAREDKLVKGLIRELLAAPDDLDRRAPFRSYLNRVDIVEAASRTFSTAQTDVLRRALRDMGTAGQMERQARQSSSKWRRARAIAVLGWLGSETSLPFLREELYDPDADIGYVAAGSLGRFDLKTAYKTLLEALGVVRLAPSRLAAVLESSAYRRPLPLLSEAAQDQRGKTRFWTAYLLGRTRDKNAFPALARLAGDRDANVRANAAEALGEIGDSRAVPLVKKLLGDESWFVRVHAAKAVGALGVERLIPDLLPLLRDDQWWVRQNTASALEKLGPPAVPYLMVLLRDPDRFARNKAAEILVRLGAVSQKIADLSGPPARAREARNFLLAVARAEAVEFLNEATEQASGPTQICLVEIVGEVGDARSRPLLEKLSQASDHAVSECARRALGGGPQAA